jgi:putative nucleotidyltransferase with HDIG domain
MLLVGILAAPICALGAITLELAFYGTSGIWWAGLFAGINMIAAGPITIALLPVAEYAFGYASDIRLMELASTGHPLLKRLMLEAPGTFHHSLIVGTLAEAGASAIHANPLLCRVAALFHDVGKVTRPQYYSENQAGAGNVHDILSAGTSREIILSHVKEGLRLAREYRLGDRVAEIIAQHHGTSFLYYFLDKAQADIQEGRTSEDTFRYPGPRPRNREAAIIMLADSVEATSRSLKDPSQAELDETIDRIVNRAYLDGQLNDCDMTLRDLHAVSEAFKKVLSAVLHSRVDYPESGKGPSA